ncbi:MAG: LysR substrate-binding domain-containing protein [Paracoccus sp. (in: a-proteobacteria)]|nr:LysR substrate-binding domain-containing protein [Paracoccus sp. (in: a-proteobacteria)]
MNITLRQLSYFRALATELHFGRAAERVSVTQPALSAQIRALEAQTGHQLIERGPPVQLTPEGRALAERADAVLAQMRQLEGAMRDSAAIRLRLGVIPTVAPYLMPAVIRRLRGEDDAPALMLREATTQVLLSELAEGQLDAVVTATRPPAPDLVETALGDDRFLLAGHRDRLARLTAIEALRPDRLDPDELLLLDEGHCLGDQALAVCGLSRGALRVDLGVASLATLSGLVAGNMGLSFLPEISARAELAANPDLALRRFAAPEPLRTLRLIRRAGGAAPVWFRRLAAALRCEIAASTAETR